MEFRYCFDMTLGLRYTARTEARRRDLQAERTHMDEVKIWALEDGSETSPLESKSHTDSESLLEDAIVKNPDLLEEGLTLIGRQTQTEGGPLDLLGVDDGGRLVLFELKRGNVTREAVAQILDYASDLESKNLDSLVDYISKHSGQHDIEKIDFKEWYGQEFDEQDLESLRPLRMFLVGLGVDAKTERMVTFMANNGMDISLLTFHAFAHDGKTFLARQVHVDPPDDSQPQPQRRSRLTKAERMENLYKEVQENGVPDLFTAVRDMFNWNWHSPMEFPSRLGLNIKLKGVYGGKRRSYHMYARIDHGSQGRMGLIFYPNAVALCMDEFIRLSQKISFQTWPRNRDLRDGDVEAQFFLTPDEWETHKDELSTLTKGVYAAWQEEQKGT